MREADGLATLVFDRAEASTNTLSAAVLVELNTALDQLDRDKPRALVIRSGKANGFIAGADVDEFGEISTEEGALAIVRRGWDTFERLASVPYPTLALVRGFCLGGGLELALACRYRVAVDEPGTRLGLPEVMLGIVPGWGGIKRLPRLTGGPAALDMLLTGKTVDARKAKKLGIVDESVPARIMENTVRGVLKALQSRGFLQSLAEPNLIAYNGEEASFLAGGEIPIPLVTGLGQVNVQYKEFGIRLTFRPTIAGDVIRLKLKPEVSTLDFTNGIVLQGFRIPALNTRRAGTEVELRDGQSFAIAGLLNNLTQTDRQSVPLLSRLPIIGTLFKSRALRADQTELMVLVTPRLVRALDPDEVPAMPVRPGAFLNPTDEENRRVPGDEPDDAEAPGIGEVPANRRPPPPGTVKPRPPGPGGGGR